MFISDLFETTGDHPFDNMMKGIAKGAKKQATADRKQQKQQDQERARAAFGNMFGGGNPADQLSIRKKNDVAEDDVNEIFGFQAPKPTVKKSTASLSQMRKEFEKDPKSPLPKIIQNKHADELRGRVHVRRTDEDDGAWPFQQVNELSNDTLASYKKKAGADASAADKAGNYERGNKRFSGIIKATKKQFANDAKGVAEATGDEKFDTIMGRMQREPTIPDPQMPPTDVKDLYQWAVKNNKPYHKIFAKWANREGYKSVAPALMKAGNLDTDSLDYWTPMAWKAWHGDDSEMPQAWSKKRVPDELRDYLETVFDAYDNIVFDWPTEYRQIGEQGVAEGLSEARNSLFAFVKQQFPTWPDYVLKDFLYAQAKGIRDQAELDDFLKRNKQDFGNCKWTLTKLPITFDIFTPKTQRMLASREGGSSNPFQVPRDAERHAQQSQMIQQKGVSAEPIIVAKLANGYDLVEGWHRTIQHLKAFPQGYTGPAWVCTGATYKSESVEQGVAEGRENFNGIDISIEIQKDDEYVDDEDYDNQVLYVTASSKGKELGHVLFAFDGEYLMPQDLEVEERYRGQGIAQIMYDYVKSKGYKIRRSGQQTDAGAGFWDKHKPGKNVWEQGVAEGSEKHECPHCNGSGRMVRDPDIGTDQECFVCDGTGYVNDEQGVAEGSEQKMSVQDTLAYLKKVMGTESHEDWRNHIINTNEYFVLKDISVNSLKSDLSGLNKTNVEKYKQMDFSKAPPIVIGSDGNILDGYHRANVAKALKVPTLKAWVGVKKQGVAEDKINPAGLNHTQQIGDYVYRAKALTGSDEGEIEMTAYDGKKSIADTVFMPYGSGGRMISGQTYVHPAYRGKGVAAGMYAYLRMLGFKIEPSGIRTDAGKAMWDKWEKAGDAKHLSKGVAEGTTVTRIDSNPITDFGSSLKAYKHTDDWSQSGVDTGDDSYWKNKNLKTNTTKGLFAGDPKRTALYATGNAHETRYVEFTQNGQPIVYFDRKDLPAMRSRKTYLTVFDASDFRQLPTGEWFSENPSKPIKQVPIGDPFKYIANQGWIVRVTDNLDKVFKQVQNMHKAGKIAQYGAEGMNESKQGVAEGLNEGQAHPIIVVDVQPEYSGMNDGDENSVFTQIINFVNKQTGPVLMFVNAEDQGLSGDTIQDIKMYWEDSGFAPQKWQRVQVVDKGYGYFRSWMDHGIEPATIVATIRELYQQKKSDSRELQFPAFNKRTPQQSLIMGAMEEMEGDPISVNWTSVSQLKRFNGAYIVGGARDQCLREVELLMNAFNIKYKRIDSLIYESKQGVAEGDLKTYTRGDPHPDQEFYFPVKDQWPEKLGPMGKPRKRKDVDVSEDQWTGSDNQWHSEEGDSWKGSNNQWHESAESGPVECHGYAYNNRDQRIMFTKVFPSEQAAKTWANKRNATILDCRPSRSTHEDSNMPVATDSTSPIGGKIDEDYELYLDDYLAEMRQDGYEV